MSSKAIGIDLGTTNTVCGVYKDNAIKIIQNIGKTLTPSFIGFEETSSNILIGEAARNKFISNSENTIYDAKRLIGRRYKDESVQEDIKILSYKNKIKESKVSGRCEIEDKKNKYTIEKISSLILGQIKKSAEEYLGGEVKDCVITVPAYFNEVQKQCTRDAGRIAGLNVMRIINEPTAAAIAYRLDGSNNKGQYVFVFDLGGGTFDVSILYINDDGDIEVKAIDGVSHLGGIDFDKRMVDYCIEDFKEKNEIDLSNDTKSVNKIKRECERGKKDLSNEGVSEVNINIEGIKGCDLDVNIDLSVFNNICQDLFDKCLKCIKNVFKKAKMNKNQINKIIRIGGSSRMKKIKDILTKFFEKDITSEGLVTNVDEAVAIGAAYQAALIEGNIKDKKILIDIVGITIGYDDGNGNMIIIFKENTILPNFKIFNFKASQGNDLNIKIYQGEEKKCIDNYLLKEFVIHDVSNNEEFEITFKIDVNSILSVFYKKKGNKQEIELFDTDNCSICIRKRIIYYCENEIKNKNSYAAEIKNKVENNKNLSVEELKKIEVDLMDSFLFG